MQVFERLRQDHEPPAWGAYGVPEEAQRVFCLALGRYIYAGSHGLWMEPDSGDGHCDHGRLAYTLGGRMSELSRLYSGAPTKSPIEAQLIGALLWVHADWAGFAEVDLLGGPQAEDHQGPAPEGVSFYITPQAKIGQYRVDFLLWFRCKRHVAGIVVECDGHAFHERTKEQAARDKSRDRDLLLAGFPVMRFTGSEIYADPIACAEQVKDALSDPLLRVSEAGGLLG